MSAPYREAHPVEPPRPSWRWPWRVGRNDDSAYAAWMWVLAFLQVACGLGEIGEHVPARHVGAYGVTCLVVLAACCAAWCRAFVMRRAP